MIVSIPANAIDKIIEDQEEFEREHQFMQVSCAGFSEEPFYHGCLGWYIIFF